MNKNNIYTKMLIFNMNFNLYPDKIVYICKKHF